MTRNQMIDWLRKVFGAEREERNRAIPPSPHTPFIGTIWGLDPATRARMAAEAYLRHNREIDDFVLTVLRHLNAPSEFWAIYWSAWLMADSSSWASRLTKVDVQSSLIRLVSSGRAIELERFLGRRKWLAGSLLEAIAWHAR